MPAAPCPCNKYGRNTDGGTRTRPLSTPFAVNTSQSSPTTSHAIRNEPTVTAREVYWLVDACLISPCAEPPGVTSGATLVIRTSSPAKAGDDVESINRLA